MRDEDLEIQRTAGLASPAMTEREASMAPSLELFVERKNRGKVLAGAQRPSISYWQDAWMRLKKNPVAIAAGVYIIVLCLCALIIPEVIHYSYDEQEVWNKHLKPSLGAEAVVVSDDGFSYEAAKVVPVEALESDGADFSFEPPAAPTGLEIVGEALTTGAIIRWNAVAEPGVTGYRVYRSIEEGTLGLPLSDIPADTVSYYDTAPLTYDKEHYYAVTAVKGFEESQPSEAVIVTPKLAVSLGDAVRIRSDAAIGDTIRTNAHYLGTDYLGRDMLARVMVGARISLFIGLVAPLLYVFIGVVYGAISGYFGGVVDDFMMRVTDIMTTLPELLVVILLQVVLGTGVSTLIIALVLVAWSRSARQIRGEVLRLREMEFMHASTVLGTPFYRVIFRHTIPNVMGTVLVILTLSIPSAIFTEAFLSFIGLGITPPLASWGTVTKEAAKVFATHPHELIIPAVLISLTMLAFNLFGDGLRDALDPKLRGTQ